MTMWKQAQQKPSHPSSQGLQYAKYTSSPLLLVALSWVRKNDVTQRQACSHGSLWKCKNERALVISKHIN